MKGILGEKIGQTQVFTNEGERLPVTLVTVGSSYVVQIKTKQKDGYTAVQLGFGQKKEKKVSKPILGHVRKAGVKIIPRFLREIRWEEGETEELGELKVGDQIKVEEIFQPGDRVDVTGLSKGKGFAGVVKRHGFAGGPATHGQSDRERAPGSIGSTTTPGRVLKGKKMAGRMGQEKVTIKNLEVLKIEPEKNLLYLKGLVPGGKHGLLILEKTGLAEEKSQKREEGGKDV